MDNQNDQQVAKRKNIVFAATAGVALIIVAVVGYITLSKIKGEQGPSDSISQEQFQTTPEISTALQSECQDSAVKIASMSDIDDVFAEYKMHAEVCREVYFSIDRDSLFRKEGMYADLAVDFAHYAFKKDKNKAAEIFNFAKSLTPWEFYLGPVSCDSHHVLDAYIESLNLVDEKVCIKPTQFQEQLIPQLQAKKYNILKGMLAPQEVVWMGQPESDVGCPEKISAIIEVIKKLTPAETTVEVPKQEDTESNDLLLSIKSGGQDKVALVFRPENECLQLRSLLVPSLDVVE